MRSEARNQRKASSRGLSSEALMHGSNRVNDIATMRIAEIASSFLISARSCERMSDPAAMRARDLFLPTQRTGREASGLASRHGETCVPSGKEMQV